MSNADRTLFLDLENKLPPYFVGIIRPATDNIVNPDKVRLELFQNPADSQQISFKSSKQEFIIIDFATYDNMSAFVDNFKCSTYKFEPLSGLLKEAELTSIYRAPELDQKPLPGFQEKFNTFRDFMYAGLSETDARLMNYYLNAVGETKSMETTLKEALEWGRFRAVHQEEDPKFIVPVGPTRLAAWLMRRLDLQKYEDLAFTKLMDGLKALKPDCGLKQAAEAFNVLSLSTSDCFLGIKYPIRKSDVNWLSDEFGYNKGTSFEEPEIPVKVLTSIGVQSALLERNTNLRISLMPLDHPFLMKPKLETSPEDTQEMVADVELG